MRSWRSREKRNKCPAPAGPSVANRSEAEIASRRLPAGRATRGNYADFSLNRSEALSFPGEVSWKFWWGRLKESRSDFSSRRLFQALGKRTLAIRSPVLHSDPRRLRMRSAASVRARSDRGKRKIFLKATPFFEQMPENGAHAPSDNCDGGIGFLATGTMVTVKRTEVARAADGNPRRFDQRPAQPLVCCLEQFAIVDHPARSIRAWDKARIGAQPGRRAKALDAINLFVPPAHSASACADAQSISLASQRLVQQRQQPKGLAPCQECWR